MSEREPLAAMLSAFLAQPRDARLALHAGAALQRAGYEAEAAAIWSLGDDVNPGLRRVKDDPKAPQEVRRDSAAADKAMRVHFTRLHDIAVDRFEAARGAKVDRVRKAVWPLTHDGPVEFREPMQQPVIFYMPDLPAMPVTPNEALGWVCDLEKVWDEVRGEYQAVVQTGVDGEPYVPASTSEPKWSKLRGELDWSAIHIFKNAGPTQFTESFPRTRAAIEAADLVRIDGAPMEAFFSRLKPGAHIPPHYGLTNTRLTVHLPLIVPQDCGIRVGETTHHWREGEIVAFDDSYEHEAWNYSHRDRVVLIFETHHPDLSQDEKDAIEDAYSVRQNWLKDRFSLLKACAARLR